jgi:RNA polymerase sigma-70 factor (ECF subfamily)
MSDAFAQLMRQHNRALFRAARAILRDDAAAEDALQEAWLRAFRALPAFRGEAKVSTWLMRIVINECLARRRRQQPALPGEAFEPATRAEDEPEGMTHRGETRRKLQAGIALLPAPLRAVFMLRAVEECSVREIASALHIPPATVRTRFFRARRRLRLALSSLRFPLEA